MKYRKKAVVIEAVQWTGKNELAIMDFVGKRLSFSTPPLAFEHDNDMTDDLFTIFIPSREGMLAATRNDWIIKGYTKEAGIHFWVNKPDYFKQAYELAEDQTTDWLALYQLNDEVKDKNITAER